MGKKSSFHISDEFNGNGQKVYLRATTHKKYAPLSQKNVRLTPDYGQYVQKAAGAQPLLVNPDQKGSAAMQKAAGALASTGQVVIKKDASTGTYQTSYIVSRNQLTNGSYLHESRNRKKKSRNS